MKKYILLAALLVIGGLTAISQSTSERKDSLKIDSIKKTLPQLKARERIESQILICEYYGDNLRNKNFKGTDSLLFYGNKILNESRQIGYKRGIAMGLLASSPDSLKEKQAREALQIGKEIGDEEVMGWCTAILNTTTDEEQYIANTLQAIAHFNKAGKILRGAYLNTWLCQTYFSSGKNEKAFDGAQQNLEILKTIKAPEFAHIYEQCLLWSYWNLAYIFKAAGDYEEAIKYIHKTEEVDKMDDPKAEDWSSDILGFYIDLGRYDSSLHYWNHFTSLPSWNDPNQSWRPGRKLMLNGLAKIYAMNKQYDTAIAILKDNLTYFDSLLKYTTGNYHHGGDYGTMVASIALSAIYDSLKNYHASLQYAKDGYSHANSMNYRVELMQACQLLSSAYHHLNNNDSAYEYLFRYNSLKDSIQSKQFLLRIYNAKKETEIEKKQAQLLLLDKDNKLKQQQLKQEAGLKKFLFAILITLILAGVFIFRSLTLKRKNEKLQREQAEQEWKLRQMESEKKQAELQQQATELEMQALRAQMNPHFIFNCLSSINRFILKNDSKAASNYLTRFSRLIRMVLLNSRKPLITLEDELQMLRLYLEMERLRFKNSFDYFIGFKNVIDTEAIYIPPLLLQPICENALWHGLMHKEGRGHLAIEMSTENEVLQCIISDNGVGREKAAELKSRSGEQEKSMGLQITTQRLALLNQNKSVQTFYTIEDIIDENNKIAGTKVTLKISRKEPREEYA